MDFTEIYQQSSNLVAFSPGTHFILTAVNDRLIVRSTDTFSITRTWLVDSSPSPTHPITARPSSKVKPSDAFITHIGWSCDSEHVFAACAKRGVVDVYKLRDEEWNARIDSGAEGLVKAEWAPDGRTVMCFSEWGLRVTMWSLVTGTATYIQYPIHPDKGYAFRSDGRYFILAERHRSKDTLGLYDTSDSYKLVRHFPLPTSSLSNFSLSPNGNYLAVWEGPLEYKLYILTLAGNLLTTFTPNPEPTLGIRQVAWHPSGAFIAIGGYDDKIHILDTLSWSPVITFEYSSRIPAGVTIWHEPQKWLEATEGRGFLSYERIKSPQSITHYQVKSDPTKPNPKTGVIQMDWNRTGTLLLVRFENVPSVIHIFSFPSSSSLPSFSPSNPSSPPSPSTNPFLTQTRLQTLILNTSPILHARWNPNPERAGSLVACTGTKAVYLWSDEWVSGDGGAGDVGAGTSKEEEEQREGMAECVGVPAKKFDTRNIHWAPDGKGLLLLDKEMFCCAFEVVEEY
ncbi:YVTN repeat-like/Quino protein amine dehydrogenase [Dendrothele bispora CBS 962.96]|uniref:YVTN repeat-like/Quino protein amine dehydrogenase n=1 Tax=Dendrothele bispora (strain CBS 962.96) TaxID=1314807 RepID=A0A4S8LVH1_DENBC|nr:YVTN repeat-like/Quino protein amine dehydrogenase [Dendrothele bispora CBS 962.96]